ncbi:MAG: segregation/condensation protein A [Verrucomicrobium sp.]|nr:segregation/condensation protein A [Verrucomicrobium sp.]
MSDSSDAASGLHTDLKVSLPVFEGPLDLLLYLIRKEEVDIYQIPIEKIAHEYLETLKVMQMLNLELAGEFLVMASTLLYIKSRRLLPQDQLPPEEEDEDASDPRWDLIRRLVEYKKFKDAAVEFQGRWDKQDATYRAGFDPKTVLTSNGLPPLRRAELFDLLGAFQKVLSRLQTGIDLAPKQENFTVSGQIVHIQRLVDAGEAVRFHALFSEGAGRQEIVVTFLALLELIRLGQVAAVQEEVFGEIQLVKAPAA